ncbi:MAG: DNA primase, partial [Christensenellales bacterium]
MAGWFADTWLEELRSRISIEETIGEHVRLKQRGKRYWGLCPFHNEKTPSFSVDSESQLYYCFGCHKGGTVFNFVMDIEHMEFPDAVKYLAERAHMPLPENAGASASRYSGGDREKLYEANVAAARYYHDLLWTEAGAGALNYLYTRGLTDADIRRFGLGASPAGWDDLTRELEGGGIPRETLTAAGLTVERDGRAFDMFRGRVIFPIISPQGRVLGFGGRAMGDAQPKYLNTPDTPVFNKRNGLYALNFAKTERGLGRLVLVEGYMDVVSLRRHGVPGVVATLGTALTEEQCRLMKRYAGEVWISYDGDAAGRRAALRALDILDAADVGARVIDYPAGMDPDDYIKEHGRAGF